MAKIKIFAAQRLVLSAKTPNHKWLKDAEKDVEHNPDKPDFPEGFFEGSPSAIANGLKAKSDSFKQAMSRLNFYINRGGDNLSPDDKRRLDEAKDALRRAYGQKSKES